MAIVIIGSINVKGSRHSVVRLITVAILAYPNTIVEHAVYMIIGQAGVSW